jgi:hypothetical protein
MVAKVGTQVTFQKLKFPILEDSKVRGVLNTKKAVL